MGSRRAANTTEESRSGSANASIADEFAKVISKVKELQRFQQEKGPERFQSEKQSEQIQQETHIIDDLNSQVRELQRSFVLTRRRTFWQLFSSSSTILVTSALAVWFAFWQSHQQQELLIVQQKLMLVTGHRNQTWWVRPDTPPKVAFAHLIEDLAERFPPFDPKHQWQNEFFLIEWVRAANILGGEALKTDERKEVEWYKKGIDRINQIEAENRRRSFKFTPDQWKILYSTKGQMATTAKDAIAAYEEARRYRFQQPFADAPERSIDINDAIVSNNLAWELYKDVTNGQTVPSLSEQQMRDLKHAWEVALEAMEISLQATAANIDGFPIDGVADTIHHIQVRLDEVDSSEKVDRSEIVKKFIDRTHEIGQKLPPDLTSRKAILDALLSTRTLLGANKID